MEGGEVSGLTSDSLPSTLQGPKGYFVFRVVGSSYDDEKGSPHLIPAGAHQPRLGSGTALDRVQDHDTCTEGG